MRAALIARGRVEFREFAPPQAREGGVVVNIAYCGLCGTDLHAYKSGAEYNPAICGHEWTGTVGAVGDNVTGLAEGDRVVVAVPPACGRCVECARSLPERCRVSFAYAVGRDERAPAHAASPDFHLPFNENPENALLLSGAVSGAYPLREQVLQMPFGIVVHPHPGYQAD